MKDLIKNVVWNGTKANDEEIKKYVGKYAKDMNVYIANLVINNGDVSFTTYDKVSYEELVIRLIREQYPMNDEFAILRKAINGITDEYRIYNLYVEECKVKAKQFIEEREKVLGGYE